MTYLPKLDSRTQRHMGLQGEIGKDWRRVGDTMELLLAGAVNADASPMAEVVAKAYPGDVLYLFSNASLAPQNAVVLAEAHPALLQHGYCSFARFVTSDHAGRFTVLFRCELELDLSQLPYLVKLVSLGQAKV